MVGVCTTLLTLDGGVSISMVVEIIALRECCGRESIVEDGFTTSSIRYTHDRA